MYRLDIKFVVKNQYSNDDKYLTVKDDGILLEESDLTNDLLKDLLDVMNEDILSEKELDEGKTLSYIYRNDLPALREHIIKAWHNNKVPQIRLG